MERIDRPKWIERLLKASFFGACETHRQTRKSEINIYCLKCDLGLCSHCLNDDLRHKFHRLLQIRRYVYQDVVRVHDLQKFFDCSQIQPYTVNSAKVLLLNPKKQSKPSKTQPASSPCKICGRSIFDQNRFCSIYCKENKQTPPNCLYQVIDESSSKIRTPESKSRPFIQPSTPDVNDHPLTSSSISSSPSQRCVYGDDNISRLIEQSFDVVSNRRIVRKGMPIRSPLF